MPTAAPNEHSTHSAVLLIACPDQKGLVATITEFIYTKKTGQSNSGPTTTFLFFPRHLRLKKLRQSTNPKPLIRHPISKRQTPFINTTYAVGIQIRHVLPQRQSSPAAAWYWFIFFTNIWLAEPDVREKDLESSALPEAKFPVGQRPRNFCY
jgi:hypothetical protein